LGEFDKQGKDPDKLCDTCPSKKSFAKTARRKKRGAK